MNFVVTIPVCNDTLAKQLMSSISRNTLLPSKVIIVDNTDHRHSSLNFKSDKFKIETYRRNSGPMKVNESWRYGIENRGNCDALCILNDDILLGKQFFSRLERIFEADTKCGVACPRTVERMQDMKEYPFDSYDIRPMQRRQGWAMTIRNECFDVIPPLPDHIIETFFGDDWIYMWTARIRRWKWVWDLHNVIWHKVGTTVKRRGYMKTMRGERLEYYDYVNSFRSKIDKEIFKSKRMEEAK